MQLPAHAPPEATTRVVFSVGPEWLWFVVALATFGFLLHYQFGFISEAIMPLPVFSWIMAPLWVGWLLVGLVGFFCGLFSLTTTVEINGSSGTVSSSSRAFFVIPVFSATRQIGEVVAVRCVQEGMKSGVTLRSITALFKVVTLTILCMFFLLFVLPAPLEPVVIIMAVAGEVMLDWTIPTARLVFMNGRSWILTRGADNEVYRQARHVSKLLEVRVVS